MKFCVRNLRCLRMISIEKNFGKIEKKKFRNFSRIFFEIFFLHFLARSHVKSRFWQFLWNFWASLEAPKAPSGECSQKQEITTIIIPQKWQGCKMKQRKKFKPNGQAIKSPYFLTVCATSLEAGKRLQGECQRSVVYLFKKIELLFSFACKIV